MTTKKDVLVRAKEILEDDSVWIKGALGRDRYGDDADVQSLDAEQFCMLGAVEHAAWVLGHRCSEHLGFKGCDCGCEDRACACDANLLLLEKVNRDGWPHIPNFNDDPLTTHEDVLLMLKRAIGECDE